MEWRWFRLTPEDGCSVYYFDTVDYEQFPVKYRFEDVKTLDDVKKYSKRLTEIFNLEGDDGHFEFLGDQTFEENLGLLKQDPSHKINEEVFCIGTDRGYYKDVIYRQDKETGYIIVDILPCLKTGDSGL